MKKLFKLKRIKIKHKLLLVTAMAACGFSVFVALNYSVATSNSDRLNNVTKIYFPVLEIADKNIVLLDKVKEALSGAVIFGEEELIDEANKLSIATKQNFSLIKKIDPSINKSIDSLSRLFDSYFSMARDLTSKIMEGTIDMKDAQATTTKMAVALGQYNKNLLEFRKNRYNKFNLIIEESKAASAELVKIGLIVGGIIITIISGILLIVSTHISNNLAKIISSLSELVKGEADLTQRLDENSNDEIGQVVSGFNKFLDKLQALILDVVLATEQLGANSGQLSMVTEITATGVATQKKETEQLVSAMDKMISSLEEVASNLSEANSAASNADLEAVSGQQELDKTITVIQNLENQIQTASEVISDLRGRSDAIGGILDVIRGIAEQTNLLALNAAIEAARAGESGRGFAVVADEVRTLAGRTQDSTTEIQEMIESLQKGSASAVEVMDESRDQAKTSVACVNQASRSLDSITNAVNIIHSMSQEISTASQEQNSFANEMNQSIIKINATAEQTSSSAQITTSTSTELSELANNLIRVVGTFKVK